jgi:hypothetical protein
LISSGSGFSLQLRHKATLTKPSAWFPLQPACRQRQAQQLIDFFQETSIGPLMHIEPKDKRSVATNDTLKYICWLPKKM